jgi:hypothetical protein
MSDQRTSALAPEIDRIPADLGKQLIATADEEKDIVISYRDAVQLSLWTTMHRDAEIIGGAYGAC